MTDSRRLAGDARSQGALAPIVGPRPDAGRPSADPPTRRPPAVAVRAAGRLVARPLGIYLVSRMVVLATIAVVSQAGIGRAGHQFPGPWPSVATRVPFLRALSTWDAAWYLHVATHGYGRVAQHFAASHHVRVTPDMAFGPVFPLLIRAGHLATGLGPSLVGAVLALVLGALAALVVWALARRLTDQRSADRALALWCLFPGAFVFSLVYAEGLTVALAGACLLCLMDRRWVLAGLAAGLATATQPSALVLIACCAWAAGLAVWRRREWAALAAPALAPLGALAYLGFLWARTGDLSAWYHVQRLYWHGQLNVYATTVRVVLRTVRHPENLNYLVPSLGLLVVVIGAALVWRWRPPVVVWLFAAGVMALALSSAPVGARPRFFVVAFPLVIAMARAARGWVYGVLLASSAALLVVVTLLTTTTVRLTP